MLVQDAVQHHLEPHKPSKIKGFRGAVQDGQDCFILRIYKNRKSLKFNDSLKNIYNRKKTQHLEPNTMIFPKNLVKSRVSAVQNVFMMLNQEVEPIKKEGVKVTAKEYLLQIKIKSRKIKQQEEYIERLVYSLGIAGIRYDKDRVQSSPDLDTFASVFAQIDEEREKLEEMKKSLAIIRVRIINQIHELNDSKFQDILNYVYVDCKSLKKVAGIMNFTYQYIKELHSQALIAFENNLPNYT